MILRCSQKITSYISCICYGAIFAFAPCLTLKIEFFEKDGKDITVLVPQGVFNLETKILSADSEVTIKRDDFDMAGQSAIFDTIKRLGTMKGHVHTEIRNGIPSDEL